MRPTRISALSVALFLLLLTLAGPTATATAGSGTAGTARWAPRASATITPGVQMFTAGAQCTGNFVFTDDAGHVYVGYAAHCAGRGGQTDTDGCTTDSHAIGTAVRFATGATVATSGTTVGRGRLAYSSWRAMHRVGTTRADACAYNDLARELAFARAHSGIAGLRLVRGTAPFAPPA